MDDLPLQGRRKSVNQNLEQPQHSTCNRECKSVVEMACGALGLAEILLSVRKIKIEYSVHLYPKVNVKECFIRSSTRE